MIQSFLKTGKIAGLHLGLSRSEVRHLLGEPKDHSERSGKSEMWKYDGLQLGFSDDSLEFIGLYFEDRSLTLPPTLVDEGRIDLAKASVPEVEKLVTELNLHFTAVDDLTFDDQRVIRIEESGVSVVFFEGELLSLQLSES